VVEAFFLDACARAVGANAVAAITITAAKTTTSSERPEMSSSFRRSRALPVPGLVTKLTVS
jgi:hypothetical protein